MFKWPGTPSPRAPAHELADYAELVCWRGHRTSTTELSADLGRLDENDYLDGVPEEDEEVEVANLAFVEIERRREACRDGYPYVVDEHGYTLSVDGTAQNHRHIVYQYLLLATRLNMNDNRMHVGIDGTVLLEQLAAEVAREYLGSRAESLVFGTGVPSSAFPERIRNLCKSIKEGDDFKNRDEAAPDEKDGRLDVVAWKHFTDNLPGKLVAFGQCKTGTNYKDTLAQLQPDAFCNKWLQSSPVVPPVRMFFVAEAVSRQHWHTTSSDAGLLFDRCRIVDFCDDISKDVLERVANWTAAASEATGITRSTRLRG